LKRCTALGAAACLLAAVALAQEPTRISDPPPIPVEEIIRRMAAAEAEFKIARDNYTYRQSMHVREYDTYGVRSGEYKRESEIVFTPEGNRFERVTYEPPSTMKFLTFTPEDTRDLQDIQPFSLTTDDLPKYTLTYQGRERIDEITTYVFGVRPKRFERGQRYFEGAIWVDDQDLQIVKTRGKAVPDIRKGNEENLFPTFETYRENIDGKYWFPTYTTADDILHFKGGDLRIRITIRYKDYKQFKVSSRIVGSDPAKPEKKKPLQEK
jgi:outer membrane lipoprotein-sorting protein